MERVKAHPYAVAAVGGVTALLMARTVKKFIEGRRQLILELDLDHKEFIYRSLEGKKLVTLVNPNLCSIEDMIAALDVAAADWRVQALICRVSALPNLAYAGDLRAAVQRLRDAGKLTIAYADSFTMNASTSYYLASAFEKVYMSRGGILNISGLGVDMPFIKGTLKKCGIEPRLLQREEYKNFANFFQEEKFTDAHREVTASLLEEIFSLVLAVAAKRKGVTIAEMEETFLRGPFNATQALEEGIIDGVRFRDEVYAEVTGRFPKAQLLYTHVYVRQQAKKRPFAKGKYKVAYIEAVGSIHEGPANKDFLGQRQSIGSDTTCADIRAAVEDGTIKAILFRVDSGGGSYIASDAISRELRRAQKLGKPVVAWMGGVAGSGGYCVSMYADKIVAQELTLTGSIGIVLGKFLMKETSDFLGLSFDRLDLRDHGEQGTLWSSLHDFTESQREKMDALTDHYYEEFKTDAAAGRHMEKARMDQLAKGRVWSGRQALENNLVDALGDIHVAVNQLKAVCKWSEKDTVQLVAFPKQKGLLAGLQKPKSSLEADKKGLGYVGGPGFFAQITHSIVAGLCANNPVLQVIVGQVFSGIMSPSSNMAPTASIAPTPSI